MDSKEQDKNINGSENSHIEVDNFASTVTTTQSRNWIWGLVIIALLIVLGILGYVGSQALFSVVFWILLILLLVIACIASYRLYCLHHCLFGYSWSQKKQLL